MSFAPECRSCGRLCLTFAWLVAMSFFAHVRKLTFTERLRWLLENAQVCLCPCIQLQMLDMEQCHHPEATSGEELTE